MGRRLNKMRKMRLHHEGNNTLIFMGVVLVIVNYMAGRFCPAVGAHIILGISIALYLVLVNFFRCPIRKYEEDTTGLVIAPADGTVVAIEEVYEPEFFQDNRLQVSIFMSVLNVHANWTPCDGVCKMVRHHDGRFQAAWLPKASVENERSTVVITTPEGIDILVRQVAGALARRIVTYPQPGEECCIDDHMGFIKFGSRVDLYLPLGTKVEVALKQKTVGNETVIAHL